MRADLLHVVTAVANPIRWESRIRLARESIQEWAADGARVTVVECAYGARPWELADIPDINHVAVRARTLVWNKECLLNIGISRLPPEAHYIGTFDADIHFRKRGWAAETVHALQIYPVIQPWADAYDLGPHDEHMQAHKSFCRQYASGFPVIPDGQDFWKFDGGAYDYPHSGYAWAWTRKALDDVGGLIDIGAMGSGDHHMAMALVGASDRSVPGGTHPSYAAAIRRWQQRAALHINRKLGYVPVTIEHAFHGGKSKRAYTSRWEMFIRHEFNPEADLKRNSYGVIEFAGNKPELERAFDQYLRSREEDSNVF
jgi:hypothetical protein